MHCASCGIENTLTARFCKGCGMTLARTCPGCGGSPTIDARFCDECGTALGTASSDGQTAPAPPGPAHLTIDEPQVGSRVTRGPVRVRGWALIGSALPGRVEILVDGSTVGYARLGLARPDVAEHLTAARAIVSGYEHVLDLAELTPEPGAVAAAAEPAGGPEPGAVAAAAEPAGGPKPALLELSVRAYAPDWGGDDSADPVVTVTRQLEVIPLEKAPPDGAPEVSLEGARYSTPSEPHMAESATRADAPKCREGDLRDNTSRREGGRSYRPRRGDGPLNLAVFAHDLRRGGAQLLLADLLHHSGAGQRYSCTVISPVSGPLRADLEARGVRVQVIPQPCWTDRATYDLQVGELAGMLVNDGYDCVLVNTALGLGGADAGILAGLPVVWAIHESWSPTTIWHYLFAPGAIDSEVKRRFGEVAGAVSAMVFAAEGTRRLYEPVLGPGRSLVIPYGVDVTRIEGYCAASSRAEARAALQAELGIDPEDRLLLSLGTVEPRKGQTLLVSTFAELAQAHPGTHLAVVGAIDTPYADALRVLVETLELGHRITVVPVVEDPHPWYRAADVLVSASDVESLPRTMLEAMAFGVPLLATGIFGVTELVDNGLNGWLHPPCDQRALRRALEQVLTVDDSELIEMGERGRATVRVGFDVRQFAEDILTLVNRLRSSSSSGARPARVFRGGQRPELRFSLGKEAARAWTAPR